MSCKRQTARERETAKRGISNWTGRSIDERLGRTESPGLTPVIMIKVRAACAAPP